MHPLVFSNKNLSNDTFKLKEMLKQDNVWSFIETMTKEVQVRESMDR